MAVPEISREDLELMTQALAREGETARLLVNYLMNCASDHDLAHSIQFVVRNFKKYPSAQFPVNRVVALLEAERPQFFDTSRPGE